MYNSYRENTHVAMTERDIKQIGKNIKKLRQERELSQEQVAAALNITQSALSHIERGESQIEIGHLLRLPSILGCRITDLLPDSVVTDYDRARASDPRVRDLIEWWEIIDDSAREQVYDSARFMTKKHRR